MNGQVRVRLVGLFLLILSVNSYGASPFGWKRNHYTFAAMPNTPFVVDLIDELDDGDTTQTTFSASGLPAWLTLDDSTLEGLPAESDLGAPIPFQLTATMGGTSVTVAAQIHVVQSITPASWINNSISAPTAMVGKAFHFDLSPLVKNPDGDELSFDKLDKPDWLKLTEDGQLYGTPGQSDLGVATITVQLYTSVPQPAPIEAYVRIVVANP